MTRVAVAAMPRDEEDEYGREGNGDFAIQKVADRDAMVEVASNRAASEIQAAMVVAKRFPRDERKAYQRIMQACKRQSLADQAVYEYPRGGETVTGPSIRLAEAMAQSWGNIDFGIIELEQRAGESTVMAYAWDLETNTRQTKIFTVKHERHTKKKSYSLTDPRDIYEVAANQGARRLRACILGVIPGDVTDAAVAECDRTMQGKNQEPLADRIRKMLAAFADLSVTQDMLEKKVGHKADGITERELLRLRKLYASIKDGMVTIEKVFDVPGETVADLNARMKAAEDQRTPGTDAEGSQLPQEEQAARVAKSPATPPAAPAPPPQPQSTATEPDVNGTTDSDVEAPPVDPLDEAIEQWDWEQFKKSLRAKLPAEPVVTKSVFEGGLFKWVTERGGKLDAIPKDQWKQLWQAVVAGRFEWKTGKVTEQGKA